MSYFAPPVCPLLNPSLNIMAQICNWHLLVHTCHSRIKLAALGFIHTGQERFTSVWHLKRAERAALDSSTPVRSLSSVVCPAHRSLPRMKLSFSVKPMLISGNATQLHTEYKSFNTPLIMHNTPVHHTHSDDCWDAYLGLQGHKHLWFLPREQSVASGYSPLTGLTLLGALIRNITSKFKVLKGGA